MVFWIIFALVVAYVYWRLVKTNGDFKPHETYEEQTVHYIQPRLGEPLERAE